MSSSDPLAEAVARTVRHLSAGHVDTLAAVLDTIRNPASPGARTKATTAIPAPGFAKTVVGLLDAWAAAAPELGGPAVATALRAAALAAEREEAEETVEIVWTGPTTAEVPVRQTLSVLIDVIRAAQERLIIVSFAAYKVEGILSELQTAAARGVEINLILETDAAAGGTLTFGAGHAFESLKDAPRSYVWPADKRPVLEKGRASMHVKAAIADEDVAFVTSANFTGFGIGKNMELGLLVRGGSVPRNLARHFMELIESRQLERVP
jgi:phosphatidylserine/phosphatidylglycerophosphate/cardiolipin synthase-like enzyme